MLASVDEATSYVQVAVAVTAVGAGIGLAFQTYLVATQNAVERRS